MTILPVLFILPIFTVSSAIFMYRFNGRRQMLKFDLIQFIYGFIVSPVLFVCLKTFMFVLFKEELNLRLSINQLFIMDTIFSVLALYVYGFVVIHSLTTSFKLVLVRDPLADLYEYSEYFHLWLSHIVMWTGGAILITMISISNIFFPFQFELSKSLFYFSMAVAAVGGIFSFAAVWLSDPKQHNFMRIMKLVFGFFFIIHAVAYFIYDPELNMPFVLYWSTFTIFTVLVMGSLFAHRSRRATRFFNRFKHKQKWGHNIQLFK